MISRQPYPSALKDAEKRVDVWWAQQVEKLSNDPATSILLLCSAAAAQVASAFARSGHPPNFPVIHALARSNLFGLQVALQSIKGDLPRGEFPSTFAIDALPATQRKAAEALLATAYEYSLVRDAYVTFRWGGYSLEAVGPSLVRFRDIPGWDGTRDDASRSIYQMVEQEQAMAAIPRVIAAGDRPSREQTYSGPPTLSFSSVNANDFAIAWTAMCEQFAGDLFTGGVRIYSIGQLARLLQERMRLAPREAEEFVQLVTFDRCIPTSALTPFHCPLIPVTESSLIVMASGFLFGNLTTCLNRLAIQRGPGLDAFSKQIEEYHLTLLKQHYGTSTVAVKTNVPFTAGGVTRDIDIVAFEALTGRLLIGMLKAFVRPDSVEEVVRANEQLAYGIEQCQVARDWFLKAESHNRAAVLGLTAGSAIKTVECAVFGNGFAGSDYLPLSPDIPVVDTCYLLLPRFRGTSIFASIAQYGEQLASFMEPQSGSHVEPIRLGEITFEVPAFTLAQ
jgi:hypothetical protein